jgi:hypothetical protein
METAAMETAAEPSTEAPTEAATVSSSAPEGHCVSGKVDNGTKRDSGNKRDNDFAQHDAPPSSQHDTLRRRLLQPHRRGSSIPGMLLHSK